MTSKPIAIAADKVPPRAKPSAYPEPFYSRMLKRQKQPLGDFFGLATIGVNRTTLRPGGESSVLHRHTVQDEMIFVLEGHPTLVTETERVRLSPGDCAGFLANGVAHQLVNETDRPAVFLEMGDRLPDDEGIYPKDDLKAEKRADGRWAFFHKNGTPYD
ncbi:cupin domain-containing protein [Bauldia sp.]|uniref:cupin domain-containing protein n=1 Tax=Bauldia sp. TaxID=2575872 RepID=UPI003BAD7CA1